jgi:hypothetical protein
MAARDSTPVNSSPTTKADRIGIDDRPFNCWSRLMMLCAVANSGTSAIELIVSSTVTTPDSRQ